eukprot:m51a1_g13133 hypothetical protein (92) ;mRNA; r:2474-2749
MMPMAAQTAMMPKGTANLTMRTASVPTGASRGSYSEPQRLWGTLGPSRTKEPLAQRVSQTLSRPWLQGLSGPPPWTKGPSDSLPTWKMRRS